MTYILFGEKPKYGPPNGFIDRACAACQLGSGWFVALMSATMVAIFLVDIVKILKDEVMLTEELWRSRIQRGNDRIIAEETEKKIKLIFAAFSLEHSSFMLLALLSGESVLILPWLTIQTLIIILETLLIILRIILDRTLPSRKEVVFFSLMVYSYVRVGCYYRGMKVVRYQSSTCPMI